MAKGSASVCELLLVTHLAQTTGETNTIKTHSISRQIFRELLSAQKQSESTVAEIAPEVQKVRARPICQVCQLHPETETEMKNYAESLFKKIQTFKM